MFRLTREVRFAVNAMPDEQGRWAPTNSFAGYPSLTGLGHYFTLQVTVSGRPDPASGYLLNIKQIDDRVRCQIVPLVQQIIQEGSFGGGGRAIRRILQSLRPGWAPLSLEKLKLGLSPYLSLAVLARELPMVHLSQRFEFSASHRLHQPALSDEENRRIYGKCNNPHGHGHNYVLEVTVAGEPDERGIVIDVPSFERIVTETIIDRFDHRHLNVEIAEFADRVPTVENIAMVIHGLLRPRLSERGVRLARVRVWETTKTWADYCD